MNKITIYRPNGEEFKTLPPKGTFRKELMKEHYVQLEFTDRFKKLEAGSYIEFKGARYTLLEPYIPSFTDEVYCQYTLKFESEFMVLKKYPMLYLELGIEESDFNTDGKIEVPIVHVMRSINRAYDGYDYAIDESLTDNRECSFSSVDVISALNTIANAWECEWWVVNKTIHFGYCKFGEEVTLNVGDDIKPPTFSEAGEYYSRYKVFGSTRNIKRLNGGVGVDARARLKLPEKYPSSTITADYTTDFETTFIFDDIYPRSVLEVTEVEGFNKVKLGDFIIKDVIETPMIHFNSGALEGRDFELQKYGEWYFIKQTESGYPNENNKPEVGDKVVVYNIVMPDEYVVSAQKELEEKALKYIANLRKDNRQYTADTNKVKFSKRIGVGSAIKYVKQGLDGVEDELKTRIIAFGFDLENERDATLTFGNTKIKGVIESLREDVEEVKESKPSNGVDGTDITIKGNLADIKDLPKNPKKGDSYWIDGTLYTWNGFTWMFEKLKGVDGATGAITYQAGVYSNKLTYEGTQETRPVVYEDGKYYYLSKIGEFKGIKPSENPDTWKEADHFSVILTDTLIADFATIGKAVFFKEYMMSQEGVDAEGDFSSTYTEYPENFTPNFLVNFVTGEAEAQNLYARGTIAAGTHTYEPSTEKRVEIDFANGYNSILRNGYAGSIWKGFVLPKDVPLKHRMVDVNFIFPLATRQSVPQDLYVPFKYLGRDTFFVVDQRDSTTRTLRLYVNSDSKYIISDRDMFTTLTIFDSVANIGKNRFDLEKEDNAYIVPSALLDYFPIKTVIFRNKNSDLTYRFDTEVTGKVLELYNVEDASVKVEHQGGVRRLAVFNNAQLVNISSTYILSFWLIYVRSTN